MRLEVTRHVRQLRAIYKRWLSLKLQIHIFVNYCRSYSLYRVKDGAPERLATAMRAVRLTVPIVGSTDRS
jgi:hypothetical protein